MFDAKATTAFHTLQDLIESCPNLFFLNDPDPFIVYADASTYDLGGCVTQLVTQPDGKRIEIPIQFMSQSFNTSQLKWEEERSVYGLRRSSQVCLLS